MGKRKKQKRKKPPDKDDLYPTLFREWCEDTGREPVWDERPPNLWKLARGAVTSSLWEAFAAALKVQSRGHAHCWHVAGLRGGGVSTPVVCESCTRLECEWRGQISQWRCS